MGNTNRGFVVRNGTHHQSGFYDPSSLLIFNHKLSNFCLVVDQTGVYDGTLPAQISICPKFVQRLRYCHVIQLILVLFLEGNESDCDSQIYRYAYPVMQTKSTETKFIGFYYQF